MRHNNKLTVMRLYDWLHQLFALKSHSAHTKRDSSNVNFSSLYLLQRVSKIIEHCSATTISDRVKETRKEEKKKVNKDL